MAKKEKKAKDPQEEKLLTPEKAVTPEGASEIKNESTESIPDPLVERNESFLSKKDSNQDEQTDYTTYSMTELVSEFKKLTNQDNWFSLALVCSTSDLTELVSN